MHRCFAVAVLVLLCLAFGLFGRTWYVEWRHRDVHSWGAASDAYWSMSPANAKKFLYHGNKKIRYTAASRMLNLHSGLIHSDQGRVTPLNGFSEDDLNRAFAELETMYLDNDPEIRGQKVYIGNHLETVFDPRMFPVVQAAMSWGLHHSGTTHSCAGGIFGKMVGIQDWYKILDDDSVITWIDENEGKFQWGIGHFELSLNQAAVKINEPASTDRLE